jgi:nucleotide-binding universal stress UspA family protein
VSNRVVIGYDGSTDSQNAVSVAASLLEDHSALVVTAWHLPVVAAGGLDAPVAAPVMPETDLEDVYSDQAEKIAQDGASRAQAAGLPAEAVAVTAVGPSDIARVLVDLAVEHDADLVVVGHRGMSRMKALVTGSVADACVHDGRRPVLVVRRS